MHQLPELTALANEDRSQRLMACHQKIEGILQQRNVERPGDPAYKRTV
jgi:hypothetical protein